MTGAVAFYRNLLENSNNVYANSFVSVVTAFAEKVGDHTKIPLFRCTVKLPCFKPLLFNFKQGETEKALELVQSDAGLKFLNANNAVSYMPLLDHFANKECPCAE